MKCQIFQIWWIYLCTSWQRCSEAGHSGHFSGEKEISEQQHYHKRIAFLMLF